MISLNSLSSLSPVTPVFYHLEPKSPAELPSLLLFVFPLSHFKVDNRLLVLSPNHSPFFPLNPIASSTGAIFLTLSKCNCCMPHEAYRILKIFNLIKDLESHPVQRPCVTDPPRPKIRNCWLEAPRPSLCVLSHTPTPSRSVVSEIRMTCLN